jgi:hypothetical protein
MKNISGVMIKLALPCVVIFIVSPSCIPSLVFIGLSFDGCSSLILNFSNNFHFMYLLQNGSPMLLNILPHLYIVDLRLLWLPFQHHLLSVMSVVVFYGSFSFFLEPLAYSPILFLWASDGSYVSGICVSILVSCPISSSIGISCVSVLTSSVCTCSVVPLGVFSVWWILCRTTLWFLLCLDFLLDWDASPH